MAESNGTEDSKPKVPSIISKIKEEFIASGRKLASDSERVKLVKAWKAAATKSDAAVKAAMDAREEESKAVMALAKAVGGTSIRCDGQIYDFASRGETVFLRRKGSDVLDV